MKISDQIGLAVTNLSRRKGRTALTVVGVVVGICAVIVMISMGIAESHNNDEMLKNMGGLTKIEVYNYGSQNINGQEVKLDNEAVQRFRKIDHVTAVTPYYQPNLNLYVEAGKNNRYRASNVWSVLGLDPDTMPLLGNKLESGDWPKSCLLYTSDAADERSSLRIPAAAKTAPNASAGAAKPMPTATSCRPLWMLPRIPLP